MTEGSLEIILLGGFRVLVDGTAVDESRWTRNKAKTLLKLLALDPAHQLSRDRLRELLGPEPEPEQALNNFDETLQAARLALEPDLKPGDKSRFLVTIEHRLTLRAPGRLAIDAEEFERRARAALRDNDNFEYALSAFAGDLLPEVQEEWATVPRERLGALRQDLLLKHAQNREKSGDPRGAIDILNQAVTAQPTNESAHRHLMRLYAALGNRQMAIHQFRACVTALQRDLDAQPESATLRLFEEIQAGERGLDPALMELIEPAPISSPVSRRFVWFSLAGLVLAAIAGGLWWWSTSQPPPIRSLAVMPFTLMHRAPMEHVSDGLTESLINSLSQLKGLRVIARSTVFANKDRAAGPLEFGKAVGAAAVLVGRITQRDARLDIKVELVDAHDGTRLWSQQYDCADSDTPALPVRISNDVARALSYQLTGDDQRKLNRQATSNWRAYELYLQGRYHANQRTAAGFRKAIQHFEQATALDPQFALAYAGLAHAYVQLGFSSGPPREFFPKALTMAEKALALDSDLAEGHTSRAMVKALYDWDWPQAEASFRKALELNPGNATARHWYAVNLNAHGRVDEARAEFAHALDLDPLSRIIRTEAAHIPHYQRDYATAIEAYRKVLELDPGFAPAHEELMLALEQAGQLDEAEEQASLLLRLERDPKIAPRFDAAVREGGYLAGLREWRRRVENEAKSRYVSPVVFAHFAIRLGEKEEAFGWLQKALDERCPPLVYLKANPIYDPLRSDARFAALLREANLP